MNRGVSSADKDTQGHPPNTVGAFTEITSSKGTKILIDFRR